MKAAVKNIKETLMNTRRQLPTSHIDTPMNNSYTPEFNVTKELNKNDVTFIQELNGIYRWATEIGRVDILLGVSLLSQYQASPREGHLEELPHIFDFPKKNPKLTLYLPPELLRMDFGEFRTNWDNFAEIYRDGEEQTPHRMPTPQGQGLTMTAFVEACHAAKKMTRRSHSGYVIFLNRAPIVWYSKRQQTLITSCFLDHGNP